MILKTYLFIITSSFLVSISHDSYAQKFFTVEQKQKSSGSSIEFNEKGEAILISEFNGVHANSNVHFNTILTYLGTPFYGDQWFEGSMITEEGEKKQGIMAFDVVNNIFYYSENDGEEALEVQPIKFMLGEHTFERLNEKFGGASNGYYEIVSSGEPKLLLQLTGRYVQTSNGVKGSYGANLLGEYEGSFVKNAKYYFVIQRQLILISNKSSFYKGLGPYTAKAIEINKKNKLNLNYEEDILTLLNHLEHNGQL